MLKNNLQKSTIWDIFRETIMFYSRIQIAYLHIFTFFVSKIISTKAKYVENIYIHAIIFKKLIPDNLINIKKFSYEVFDSQHPIPHICLIRRG